MYDELLKRLRDISNSDNNIKSNYISLTMLQAADAIEELMRRCEQFQYMPPPCWIPVTETKKPKSYEPVMVIYIGWNDALPHRDITAYWSEDEGLWRWAETDDRVKVSITHYMPLPPLPEPPKEET